MTELKLVAPDQPTPLERQLLSAAANESPSAEQRLRVRQALGLPAVALAPPVAIPTGRRALAVKAAVGSLIVVSAAALFLFSRERPQSVAVPVPTPAVVVVPQPQAQAEPAAPPVAVSPLPELESPAPSTARKSPVRAAAAALDTQADLSEQLRLIEAARSGVATRNAKAASAALTEYSSRFPRGVFGQEAAVLRIETLDVQGNHAQAAKLAQAFLARHPNSPHVNVVRRIAGTTP